MESPVRSEARVVIRSREAKEAKEAKEARGSKDSKKKQSRSGESVSAKKARISPKDIIAAATKVNFLDIKEREVFERDYKQSYMKPLKDKTVLHILADQDDWPSGTYWSSDKLRQFLDWFLLINHDLLEKKNGDDYTPLHLSLVRGNAVFVDALLNGRELKNLNKVLPNDCQYGNPLHLAIKYRLPIVHLIMMVDKCTEFEKMFIKGEEKTGQTPLHICMSMDLNKNDEDEEEDDPEPVDDSDSDDDDRANAADDEYRGGYSEDEDYEKIDEGDRGNSTQMSFSETNQLIRTPSGLNVHPSRTNAMGRNSKRVVLQSPIIPQQGEADCKDIQDVLTIVEILVRKHESVLGTVNKASRTPYQERIHQLESHIKSKDQYVDEKQLQLRIAKDPIASYIRLHCVRNFDRDRIMRCLYRPGQERHIEFDLGGFPYATISEDYLERLKSHLKFESILKYVAIPKLTMDYPTRKMKAKKPSGQRGLSDLTNVFKWLRENGVERIVRVMVLDDRNPSHSDTSIKQALSGFHIETWDWKKLDLNSDVVCNSTSVVREISLYSSGNNAVLMGWASSQGLPNSNKFPNLEKVNLFIRKGLEDDKTLSMYIENFKTTICGDTKGRVQVQEILDDEENSYTSEFKNSGGATQSENTWIDCLVTFSDFLISSPMADKIKEIKIAVIDDGVDASLAVFDNKIKIGKSFCLYANSEDLTSPYYIPSGNHGTCMATIICQLCPWVSLYVARLDERTSSDGKHRQVTPKSAAEAISWATGCGVDMISMSWTIETPVEGNKDMESLKAAVSKAALNGILMFCSTSDQGNSTKDYCYPGDFPDPLRIGSATDTGEPSAWVNPEKVDFLLPGKNIPFKNNEDKIVSFESGSSVATAAATGLAGLLVCCSRLLKEDGASMLKSEHVKKVFTNMSQSPGSKNHFPQAREFVNRFKRYYEAEKTGKSINSSSVPSNLPAIWDDNCGIALKRLIDNLRDAY